MNNGLSIDVVTKQGSFRSDIYNSSWTLHQKLTSSSYASSNFCLSSESYTAKYPESWINTRTKTESEYNGPKLYKKKIAHFKGKGRKKSSNKVNPHLLYIKRRVCEALTLMNTGAHTFKGEGGGKMATIHVFILHWTRHSSVTYLAMQLERNIQENFLTFWPNKILISIWHILHVIYQRRW